MEEKEKKNGYIVRPMNAFMMYRSAYSARAQGLYEQNNHQIVSKATGQSWRLEPQEVKDYYKNLSEIERLNHQKAWPNYKFSPAKSSSAVRKRKSPDVESEAEDSDQDTSDYDWTPAGGRKPRPFRHVSKKYSHRQPQDHIPYVGAPAYNPMPTNGRTYFHFANPGHSAPVAMHGLEDVYQGAHYYQPAMHNQYQPNGFLEEVGSQYDPYPSSHAGEGRHGVPGGASNDLFDFDNPPEMTQEQLHIDPALAYESQPAYGSFTEQGFGDLSREVNAQHVDAKIDPFLDAVPNEHGLLSTMFDTSGQDKFEQWIQETNGQASDI